MKKILEDAHKLRKRIKLKEREIDSPVITMSSLIALDELIEVVGEIVEE